jgi:hypothetical protein
MSRRSLPYDPTPEHQLTRAKWARGFGIVYGTVGLLLFAVVLAQHIRGEGDGTTTIGKVAAAEQCAPTCGRPSK